MEHFVDNFKPLDKKIITEKHFLFEVVDGIWIQGYIDAMYQDKNGDVVVIDWKTSSKFTGDKLTEAGRQLLLYKMAVERLTNHKVSRVAWFMIKYAYVKYGNRKKMCSRRKWVQEMKTQIMTQLKKLDNEDFINEMLLEEAIKNNSLNNMPKEIQDYFQLEDCILYYDVTDNNMDECLNYIEKTVNAIESEENWNPVEINKKTEFFCNGLCNQRDDCKYLTAYRTGEPVVDNDVANDLMNLFG